MRINIIMSEPWSVLLRKLRDSCYSESKDEHAELLQSLVQQSIQLENRQLVVKSDVQVISKLLSDWSDSYKNQSTLTTPTSGLSSNVLLNILKLLRNICADVQQNQANILCTNCLTSLSSLITLLTESPSSPWQHDAIVTTLLQLLGNICVGFPEGQREIWKILFPHKIKRMLEVFSDDSDIVCMILHNCTCMQEAGECRRKDLISESEGLGILSRVVQLKSEGKGLEWRTIFLKSLLELTPPSLLHTSLLPSHHSLWNSLMYTLSDLLENEVGVAKGVWSMREESECVYLVTVWKSEVEKMLSNGAVILIECFTKTTIQSLSPTARINVESVCSILRVLCSLSVGEITLVCLQSLDLLMDTAIALLRQLSMLDGSATSGKSRCNLRDVVNSDAVEREEVALFGMKRDLLQLISSLLYHCTKMQDKVRELEAIHLLLNQCHIDHNNPYIMQWSVLAIRNLCEKNPTNQEQIARLEARDVAKETGSQFEFGCEIQIGSDGKLTVKQKST